MIRNRILLVVSAALITFLLFSLPKVVVDNDEEEIASTDTHTEEDAQHQSNFDHGVEIDEETTAKINNLRENLKSGEINEKSLTFADSLVSLFQKSGKLDSAAKYLEWKAVSFPNEENLLNAGLGYYEAFGYAVDQQKLNELGQKARKYLTEVLNKHPERLDIKSKIAMTYVSTSNPMQGIMMLREVVEEDPEHVEATFNLGLLSRQSGQYDKAVERFSKLVAQDESNIQARFLLGLSYYDLGKAKEAKEHFEIIKNTSDDPSVLATVESYLEEIN